MGSCISKHLPFHTHAWNHLQLADLLSALGKELDHSKTGWSTQFKSLPSISRWVLGSGRRANRSLKNFTSSQLGAYRLTNTTGILNSLPCIITNLPSLSSVTLVSSNKTSLCTRMAVPRLLFEANFEWSWRSHPFSACHGPWEGDAFLEGKL